MEPAGTHDPPISLTRSSCIRQLAVEIAYPGASGKAVYQTPRFKSQCLDEHLHQSLEGSAVKARLSDKPSVHEIGNGR